MSTQEENNIQPEAVDATPQPVKHNKGVRASSASLIVTMCVLLLIAVAMMFTGCGWYWALIPAFFILIIGISYVYQNDIVEDGDSLDDLQDAINANREKDIELRNEIENDHQEDLQVIDEESQQKESGESFKIEPARKIHQEEQ